MSVSKLVSLLGKTEVFAPFTQKQLSDIRAFSQVRKFGEGEVLFVDSSPGDCLYVVEDGEIAVTRAPEGDESGRRIEVARYVNGNLFGEMDLMIGSERGAEAKAARASTVVQFPAPGKTLADFTAACPNSGAQLLYRFLQVASARIRATNAVLKENSPWVQEMRNQVYQDKLTGIYNKSYLSEQLGSFLKDGTVSLLMVKPDNFKEINDTYGHEAGDQSLVITARSLARFVREGDVVCRFAGNELAVIAPGVSADDAYTYAERIRTLYNTLDLTDVTGGVPFSLSVSIGIAVYPQHADNSAALIDAAHELPLIGRGRGGNKILYPEDK
jgi:diguanylate cyclase (GGDEF)-like protein